MAICGSIWMNCSSMPGRRSIDADGFARLRKRTGRLCQSAHTGHGGDATGSTVRGTVLHSSHTRPWNVGGRRMSVMPVRSAAHPSSCRSLTMIFMIIHPTADPITPITYSRYAPRTSNTQPPTGADTMRMNAGSVTVKIAIVIVTCRARATSPMKTTSATA